MQGLIETVILLGVLQGAVLAPVLWTRRANRLANRILAALVGAVALMMLLADLQMRWAFRGHPDLLALGAPLPFLFGPLLYLYAVALTRPVVTFDRRWLIHALPFVADVVFMSQGFYFESGDTKLALAAASDGGHPPVSLHVVNALEVLQAFVYLFLTWQVLDRYGRKMRGYFSDLTGVDLRWLKRLVIAHAGVWSVVLLSVVLHIVATAPQALGIVIQTGSSVAIFVTGYVSLWQPELAPKAKAATLAEPAASVAVVPPSDAPAEEPPGDPAPTPAPAKYQRNRLPEEEASAVAASLESLMKEKALYRDGALTLPMLADALAVPPHTLSQVLNVRLGKSFFVYVNTYRAEALKEALADPKRASRGVLELAFEVGFNSKSTLNSFFKTHTGMTPTQYRRDALSEKNGVRTAV